MLHRLTLIKLAEKTGISRSTIYRYLDNPHKVGAKNRVLIEQGLEDLNIELRYLQSKKSGKKIIYFLPEGVNGKKEYFFGEMAQHFTKHCSISGYEGELVRIALDFSSQKVEEYVAVIKEKAMQADVLMLTLPNLPQFNQCVDELVQAGVKVITLIMDLPRSNRQLFIGIDNFAAGRTAGFLVSQVIQKTAPHILVVSSSFIQEDILQRIAGFRSKIMMIFPDAKIEVLEISHGHSTLFYEKLKTESIDAVYSTPISNHLLTDLLKATKTAHLPVISHELTSISKRSLLDGSINFILRQNADALVAQAVHRAHQLVNNHSIDKSSIIDSVQVITPENIPASF